MPMSTFDTTADSAVALADDGRNVITRTTLRLHTDAYGHVVYQRILRRVLIDAANNQLVDPRTVRFTLRTGSMPD